jgi:ribonuclease BN (tRNA processing enzyme)
VIVRIVGNGGFLNTGIPYNSLLLGTDFLVEAPPDIMISLHNQDIPIHRIKRIYLSHYHGDHYFGMPFLALNLLNYYLESGLGIIPIEVIGPKKLRDHLIRIQEIATSADNPSVTGFDNLFTFTEINKTSKLKVSDSVEMMFHLMNHSKETYGFSLLENGSYIMTYLIDTKWDDSFVEILSHQPKYVLCDLNSHPDDKIREHLTESDIVKRAMPITGANTRYIGIHLSGIHSGDVPFLSYSRIGETFEVGKI